MRFRRFCAVLVAVILGAAPVLITPPARAANKTTLTVAVTGEGIDSLNPFLAYFSPPTMMLRLMYEFLITTTAKDGTPTGALADKWSYSKDKLTWTYHIRNGVKWSDGKPVTANDAAFTFNLMMHNPDAARANGSYVANFASVKATNDHTLVIRTKSPQATMTGLRVPIVPEHIWKSHTKNIRQYANDKGPIVGNGPYILTEYKPNQYVRMEANKHYWRGAPKVDQLVFRLYDSSDAAVQALRKGEVDLVNGLTPAQANALKGEDNIALHVAQGKEFVELSMIPGAASTKGVPIGNGHPALRDRRVREALSYAIDNKTLVKRVFGGYAQPGTGYIPPIYQQYHWNPLASMKRDFDLAKANKILDDAGYKRDSNGKRHMPGGGRALDFRYLGHQENAFENTVGTFLRGWFAKIGVGLTVTMESGTKLNTDLPDGNYDLVMGGWNVNPDPDYVLSIQRCSVRPVDANDPTSSSTDDYWCDKDYDKLYNQQLRTFDPAKRAVIIKRMEQVFYQQVPSDILYYPNAVEAYRSDKFHAFQVQPDPGGQIMYQDGIWSMYQASPKADSGGGSGIGTAIKVVVGIVIIGACLVGAVALRHRAQNQDERE